MGTRCYRDGDMTYFTFQRYTGVELWSEARLGKAIPLVF